MKYKNVILPSLLSLPLLYVLFTSSINFSNLFEEKNISWLALFVIEGFCYFALYLQAQTHKKISPKEQKLLVVFVCCIFLVFFGTTVALLFISDRLSFNIPFALLTVYTFVNIIISTTKIVKTPQRILNYFKFNYIFPYIVTCVAFALIALLTIDNLNMFAFFLLIRNVFSIKFG